MKISYAKAIMSKRDATRMQLSLIMDKKHDAHAGSHDVLCNPEKGIVFGVSNRKGNYEPCDTQTKAKNAGYNVKLRNVTKVFSSSAPDNLVSNPESSCKFGKKWEKDDLRNCLGTANGVHDFDDIVNLKRGTNKRVSDLCDLYNKIMRNVHTLKRRE